LPILRSNAELLILSSIISRIGTTNGVKRLAFIASLSIINSKRNRRNLSVLLSNSSKLRKINNTFNRLKKTLYGFFRPLENKLRSNSRLKSFVNSRLKSFVNSRLKSSVNSRLKSSVNNRLRSNSESSKPRNNSKRRNSSKLGNNTLRKRSKRLNVLSTSINSTRLNNVLNFVSFAIISSFSNSSVNSRL